MTAHRFETHVTLNLQVSGVTEVEGKLLQKVVEQALRLWARHIGGELSKAEVIVDLQQPWTPDHVTGS